MSRAPITKLAKDPKALEFLRKHQNDPVIGGGFSAATPYHNYPGIINLKRKRVVDAIFEVLADLPKDERKLMQLYLEMPPRKVADKLGWPRSKVYIRLRLLRDKCVRLAMRKRDGYVNQRAPDQRDRPESTPQLTATRTLALTFADEVRYVHFVPRVGWCDDEGLKLSAEVNEILLNHSEDIDSETAALQIEEV